MLTKQQIHLAETTAQSQDDQASQTSGERAYEARQQSDPFEADAQRTEQEEKEIEEQRARGNY